MISYLTGTVNKHTIQYNPVNDMSEHQIINAFVHC